MSIVTADLLEVYAITKYRKEQLKRKEKTTNNKNSSDGTSLLFKMFMKKKTTINPTAS